MIVYGSSLSPFVRKVLAYGAEKGLDLELKSVPLGCDDPDFIEASPFHKMPGFRDGDFAISDSSAIIQYLEASFPQPELIPTEAKARARTIWFDEFGDTILSACGAKMFFNRIVAPRFLRREGDLAVADKAEHEELPPILDYCERVIPESGWLVEDRLTLADIAVATSFANLRHLGIGADPARHPRLAAYIEKMLARPSFAGWCQRETEFLDRTAFGGVTMADHVATIAWRSDGGDFARGRYSRGHLWSFDGGAEVRASSSPHVVPLPFSDPAAVDPEEALIAATSSCHMLFFLHVARESEFAVGSYRDNARGTMGKDEDGRIAVTRIALSPEIEWIGEAPDAETLARMHHEAHEACFIANSLKTEIVVE